MLIKIEEASKYLSDNKVINSIEEITKHFNKKHNNFTGCSYYINEDQLVINTKDEED